MKYQLVLQFRGDSLADFDAMVSLEEQLIEDLRQCAEVDGHDCGSGETNIFIFTSDPAATFWKAHHTLQREGKLQVVTAACRPIDGGHYKVIWPERSQHEFRVT